MDKIEKEIQKQYESIQRASDSALDKWAFKKDLKQSKLVNTQRIVHMCRQVIRVADRMQSAKYQAQQYLEFIKKHRRLLAWRDDKLSKNIDTLDKYSQQSFKLKLGATSQLKRYRPSINGPEHVYPNSVPAKVSIQEYLQQVRQNNICSNEACEASKPAWLLKKIAWRYVERDNRILIKLRRHNNNYYEITKIIHYMLHLGISMPALRPLSAPMNTIEPRLLKSHGPLKNQLGRIFYDKWHKLLYLAVLSNRGDDYALYNYSHFLHNISLDLVGSTSVSDYSDYRLYIAPYEKHPIL